MGWSIQEGVNDVVVSKECAKELFRAQEEGRCSEDWWDDADSVTRGGRLIFNGDHMEHMDYIGTDDTVVAILCGYKVKGDICFESHEGDNAGKYWGYRFDGKGGMKLLRGVCTVVFEELREPLKGKTVVITGTLDAWTRDDAHAAVRAAGGKVSDSVTSKTDYVVVGAKPGSKAVKAKKLGRPMLDEKAFLELLKGS